MGGDQNIPGQCEEYVAYFTPFLEAGKDILHVTLSSGISGTINSAHVARQELAENSGSEDLYCGFSGASSGYGLLMDKLADLRDEGMEVEELARWTEKTG